MHGSAGIQHLPTSIPVARTEILQPTAYPVLPSSTRPILTVTAAFGQLPKLNLAIYCIFNGPVGQQFDRLRCTMQSLLKRVSSRTERECELTFVQYSLAKTAEAGARGGSNTSNNIVAEPRNRQQQQDHSHLGAAADW